jgi:hypothetical protein
MIFVAKLLVLVSVIGFCGKCSIVMLKILDLHIGYSAMWQVVG